MELEPSNVPGDDRNARALYIILAMQQLAIRSIDPAIGLWSETWF